MAQSKASPAGQHSKNIRLRPTFGKANSSVTGPPYPLRPNPRKRAVSISSSSTDSDSETTVQKENKNKPRAVKKQKIAAWKPQILTPNVGGAQLTMRPFENERMYRKLNRSNHSDEADRLIHEDVKLEAPFLEASATVIFADQSYFFNLGKKIIVSFSTTRKPSVMSKKPTTLYNPVFHSLKQNTKKSKALSEKSHTHLDYNLPAVSDIYEIFQDMAKKADELGFRAAVTFLNSQAFRVVTMCSGTESPVLSMRLLQEAYERENYVDFKFNHLASAEIEPFKQAYIERNFSPPALFRDVTEFSQLLHNGGSEAHTAYGSLAVVPKNVHLLVAGSSCVDYSHLNTNPKTFGKTGESYSTMKGIHAYAQLRRPNVIILENVAGAPWKDIKDFWEDIDYAVEAVKVDTKNYYIPHTRQRGYLVAIDNRLASSKNLNTATMLEDWKNHMASFQRRASSPYTDFILSDDDAALQEAKKTLAATIQPPNKRLGWAKCRSRYANIRYTEGLGFLRPLSNWENNGSCKFPDHSWMIWAKNQRERIWDTIDIQFLDDRDSAGKHWGIVNCITPSGMPYETRRGGPLIGQEALALQGIPVDDLLLKKETSRQLQDLAGNAMTSTVVGAAIFSAMIAAAPIFEDFSSHSAATVTSKAAYNPSKNVPHQTFETASAGQLSAGNMSTQVLDIASQSTARLADIASRSRQLCKCESMFGNTSAGIYICADCGHTTCLHCAGNPPHNYQILPKVILDQRLPPNHFARTVDQMLPRSIEFDTSKVVFSPDFYEKVSSIFINQALGGYYCLADVKRGVEWKVQYDSGFSRLELSFVPNFVYEAPDPKAISDILPLECYWLLSIKTDISDADRRKGLSERMQPLAKMYPRKFLLEGTWEFWVPNISSIKAMVSGQGEEVDAWEKQLGLQGFPFTKLMSYPALNIQTSAPSIPENGSTLLDIDGIYHRLPQCGAANRSLHRLSTSNTGVRATFLFLDPTPIGDAKHDRYVIANNHELRPQHDQRQIMARFPSGWRPFVGNLKNSIDIQSMNNWKESPALRCRASSLRSVTAYSTPPVFNVTVVPENTCHQALKSILVAQIPLNNKQKQLWLNNKTYNIDIQNRADSISSLNWVLSVIGKDLISDEWNLYPNVLFPNQSLCTTCTPSPPSLSWQKVRVRRSDGLVVRPFEDSKSAANYEQALKMRPSVVTLLIHGHGDHAVVELQLSLKALLHRSLPLLGGQNTTVSKSARSQWRIVAYDSYQPCPRLNVIEPLSNAGCNVWTAASCLMDTKAKDDNLTLPRNFRRQLWKTQLKTLTWMQAQEEKSGKWDEREMLELCLPNLSISIESQTWVEKVVKGGIIADDVGAGKTTTMLALLATDLPDIGSKQKPKKTTSKTKKKLTGSSKDKMTLDNPRTVTNKSSKITVAHNTKIHTDATLILVPRNLISQWLSEVDECFSTAHGAFVVTIRTVAGLQKLSIETIRTAKVIVASWDLFEKDDYWELMRQLCCAPNIPRKSGRAFQEWLSTSLNDLSSLVDESNQFTDEAKFWKLRTAMSQKNCQKYKRFEACHQPSKKKGEGKGTTDVSLGSLVLQEAAPKPVEQKEKLEADYQAQFEKWPNNEKHAYPVLHLFSFRRLIVDEFTYLHGKSLLALLRLEADRRWILSGTPPLTDFDSINTMSKLLGTAVSSVDERHGCFEFGRDGGKMENAKSYVEEFLHYNTTSSASMLQLRYQRTNDFVAQFMRRDVTNLDGIRLTEKIIVVQPSPLELARYFEFYIPLSATSFKKSAHASSKKATGKTRQDRVHHEIELRTCSEEALICCASSLYECVTQDNSRHGVQTAMEAEFLELCQQFLWLLRGTFWYYKLREEHNQDGRHLPNFVNNVLEGTNVGDGVMVRFLDILLGYAFDSTKKPKRGFIGSARVKVQPEEPKNNEKPKVPQKSTKSEESGNSGRSKGSLHWAIEDMQKDSQDLSEAERLLFDSQLYNPDPKVRQTEMTARVTALNSILLSLVGTVRHLRFFKVMSQVDCGKAVWPCSRCNEHIPDYTDSLVSCICGHVICRECWEMKQTDIRDQGGCPVVGCSALLKPQALVAANMFDPTNTSPEKKHGSRMDAVIEEVEEIIDGESDDYILLFVQYPSLKDHLIAAFTEKKIAYQDGTSYTQRTVNQFKQDAELQNANKNKKPAKKSRKGKGKCQPCEDKEPPRVLILMLDSADSAGWNLQVANHVMFVAPFVARSKYDYDSIMKQAVGRSYRFGQTKEVFVYHFAMSRTIEVNILEDRNGKALVSQDEEFLLVSMGELVGDEERFRGAELGTIKEDQEGDDDDDGDDAEEEDGECGSEE